MSIRLYEYKIPLRSKNWKVREGLILNWNGGWGEIAPLPGFSKETFDEAKEEVLQLLPHLKDAKPTLPSVKFGLSSAKRELKSVRIPLCGLGEKMGFSTLKLKLGDLAVDQAISLVKKWVPKCRLRLDCNRKWNLNQALEFTKHFNPSDIDYMEEPVESFEELLLFSKITRFPVAVDESVRSEDCWPMIPTLKAVVIKPTVVGEIPKLPEGVELILSSAYESGLGLLHIASLSDGKTPIGLDTYSSLLDDILRDPIDCSSGFFSWPFSNHPVNLLKLCQIAP